MSPASARRRAGILLYAALQFVVLIAIAMVVYAGGTYADPWANGYDFLHSFLSELGATRSWGGQPNHAAAVLFSIALGGLGVAFVAFAGAWRAVAFERERARAIGFVAQGFGCASGTAFVAVAVTPINVALQLHNTFVVAAFGLLLGYAASMTVLWWRNGTTRVRLAASLSYLLLVGVYVGIVIYALRNGIRTEREHVMMVVAQKAVVAASMLYVVYLTVATRLQLAASGGRA